jgi:methionyl-tRNA synthetase
MTAIGYGAENAEGQAEFARYWPADLHLVGKEIIRFHCVYWPAFLLAADLPLPKAITAHGWLLFDNAKMSKSKGNIVRTETILEAFGEHVYGKQFPESTKRERDLFAADVLRYFLLREIPFGQDGSFSFDALVTRYNADLANGYGNLVSRTLALITKTSEGLIEDCLESNSLVFYQPERKETLNHPPSREVLGASECQLLAWRLREITSAAQQRMQERAFADALGLIASAIASVDQLMTSRKPWAATDTDLSQQGRRSTLYAAAEAIRIITAFLYPVLPATTAKVWSQLGLGNIEAAAKNGELTNLEWGGLKPGTQLGPLAPIFPRAPKELADIMADIEEKNATESQTSQPAAESTAAPPPPLQPNPPGGAPALVPPSEETVKPGPITIDDFTKIELRVAQVLVAERIPKADKLLRLEVDLGYEKRQILSGIAEWYAPEDLIGRRIIVVTNLAPRKMRGLESHGMLLAGSETEGSKPILATMADDVALGTRLK